MPRYSTQNSIEQYRTEQNRTLTSITSNTIPHNAVSYRTTQCNTTLYNLSNTDYRIALYRTTADCSTYHSTLLYGAQRSAASPLNMHLLTLADALAPALGLSLTPVIRTSCSNHNGTRSILASSSSSSPIPHNAIQYHTIPYHTILHLFKLCIATARFYSTGLDWTGAACLSLALV